MRAALAIMGVGPGAQSPNLLDVLAIDRLGIVFFPLGAQARRQGFQVGKLIGLVGQGVVMKDIVPGGKGIVFVGQHGLVFLGDEVGALVGACLGVLVIIVVVGRVYLLVLFVIAGKIVWAGKALIRAAALACGNFVLVCRDGALGSKPRGI